MPNTSKKDIARVLAGEKRARAWKSYIQANPSVIDPCDKDGVRKQVRANFVRGGTYRPDEVINRDQAIRSGGVTPDVTLRSADSKFGKMHREFSGQILQGKVQVSTIDGHVYGSVQKVGRSLEEAARDEGMGKLGQVIGKGRDYVAKPCADKRPDSPFKRAGRSPFTVVIKKAGA